MVAIVLTTAYSRDKNEYRSSISTARDKNSHRSYPPARAAPRSLGAADRSRAHSDGTLGNRFDDPKGYYRVLMLWGLKLISMAVDAGCQDRTLHRFAT